MDHVLPMNPAWVKLLNTILTRGQEVSPRGMKTLEIPQHTIAIDMRHPVLTIKKRRLNYKFMVAEALWMLNGQDDVETLAKHNKRMREFSDDGITLAGAYGPRIQRQLDYVVRQLMDESTSRQATLTTWIPNPVKSKDIPCTLSMSFMLRRRPSGLLGMNMHVFMRSSDAWLGIPYDVFSFSAVARHVTAMLNDTIINQENHLSKISHIVMGDLYITAASSHLYEEHWEKSREIVSNSDWTLDNDWTESPGLRSLTSTGEYYHLKLALDHDLSGVSNVWSVVTDGVS